ncbi:MAG: RDD family protein [Streptococcaceae bacterium]|jgi:uncharacterized RDD family membrane protein YckC|nr:RDD family protein [Streptococcaceae bacterium]
MEKVNVKRAETATAENQAAVTVRGGTWLIDWMIGGILISLPAILSFSIVDGKGRVFSNLYVFEAIGKSPLFTMIIGFLCLLSGFFYYVIVPWKIFPGQTLAKRWLHLEIVRLDGKALQFKDCVFRQFIFLFLIEGIATPAGNYILPMLTTMTRYYIDSYVMIVWTVVTMATIMFLLLNKKHRALHDFAAKTTVITIQKEKDYGNN